MALLVGMDIDGVVGLSEETRRRSDELRFRHRQVLAILGEAGEPVPAEVYGMTRVADALVGEAADLLRRAALFRDAEQMPLDRMSLSMMVHAWSGDRIDPSNPDVEALSVAQLQNRIDVLGAAGADPQQIREFEIMLAIVTATELASERRELQADLDDLSVLPDWEWVVEQRRLLEVGITELLLGELRQEKLIIDLESGLMCGPGWDADRYEEIEIQIAFLEWQLAKQQSMSCLADVETLLGSIAEAGVHDQMSFVELVAGNLEAHPDALPVALLVLADMDEAHQTAVMAAIADNGHLDGLFTAVEDLEASMEPQHSSWGPVGDFLGGFWDSIWGSVTGLWGLTLQGLYDQDGWKENWSGLGQSFQMLFESPGDFLYQLADIATLKENPARWLGGIGPDVIGAVVSGGAITAAAKGGRLGRTLARIADKLDNLTVRLGARLEQVVTNPALRNMIRRLSNDSGVVGRTFRVADIDPARLLDEIIRRGDLPEDIFTQLDGHLLDRHVGWTDEAIVERMEKESLPRVSTFFDEQLARDATVRAIKDNAEQIEQWLEGGPKRLTIEVEGSGVPIGRTVRASGGIVRDAYNALIVLKKTPSGSWYVLTGYPT